MCLLDDTESVRLGDRAHEPNILPHDIDRDEHPSAFAQPRTCLLIETIEYFPTMEATAATRSKQRSRVRVVWIAPSDLFFDDISSDERRYEPHHIVSTFDTRHEIRAVQTNIEPIVSCRCSRPLDEGQVQFSCRDFEAPPSAYPQRQHRVRSRTDFEDAHTRPEVSCQVPANQQRRQFPETDISLRNQPDAINRPSHQFRTVDEVTKSVIDRYQETERD